MRQKLSPKEDAIETIVAVVLSMSLIVLLTLLYGSLLSQRQLPPRGEFSNGTMTVICWSSNFSGCHTLAGNVSIPAASLRSSDWNYTPLENR